jgi:type IV pilus assembly protein PilM
VVVDGELRDSEALARALSTFFKDHGLPTKNVRLGLSSSRVGVRTFEISGIDDGDRFDNAVRFKAHEVLPVAAHESVLDYRVVEERYTESGEVSRRVLLVVAPRDQVEPYFEACREAGLRLAGVDLEAFGLLRAFVQPLGSRSRSEDSATVVVAVGHEASTLLVAGGGICEFTRVFDWGGGALQEAIAEELDVPLMEAATILAHLSLSGPGRHLDALDADARGRALQAVRARLTPFARELVSSLQFYQTQPESLGIREILITGGTSHLEGLADALHQMIGVSVSLGDPLGRVDVQTEIPTQIEAQIGSLAVPIGLAIEDDPARSVDLMPKEARQSRKRPNALRVLAPVAVLIPLAALVFLFMQASGTASDRQAELDAVRAQIVALPEPTRPNIDPSLVGEAATRATAVAQILGGRLSWERVLGDVSRVVPASVSLTELNATAPQPTTPEVALTTDEGATTAPPPVASTAGLAPTGVTVMGYALDYATIARTLARIQAVPSLTNVELQSATPKTVGKKRIIEFTIVADLAIPGGAPQ